MELKRPAGAQPTVCRGEVVKQEQLTRTELNTLLDGIQVKTAFREVVSLLANGIELHTAQESCVTGAWQYQRVIDRLDQAGEDALDIARRALDAVAGVRRSVPAEPIEEHSGLYPRSLAEQWAKRDDAGQRSRWWAVSMDVQGGEARHVRRAMGRNREPEIDVQSLEVAALRSSGRNGELPHHAQGRHASPDGVLSSRLPEDGSCARPREPLAVLRRAQMHEPGAQELGGSRRSIDLDGLRFEHGWRP